MTAREKEFDPQIIASTFMGCVEDTFKKMYNISFSQDPDFTEKKIIEYNSRMRTFGLEKFNGPCYVSAVNFYLSTKEMKERDAIGAVVIYVKEEPAVKLLRALGFKDVNENDEEMVKDYCGELANIIVGQFKNELTGLGYKDLTISPPVKEKNDIPQGVEFSYNEFKLYEIGFYLWNEKSLVIGITMGPVPHA